MICGRIRKSFLNDGVTPRYKLAGENWICQRCYLNGTSAHPKRPSSPGNHGRAPEGKQRRKEGCRSPNPTSQPRSEAATAAKEWPRGPPRSAFHPDGSARTCEAIQDDGMICGRISKSFLTDGVTPRYKLVGEKWICQRCYLNGFETCC